MIAITSIAPGHKNYDSQLMAIESWITAGYEVVSLNAPEEISQLEAFKNVKFIPTVRHNKKIFGKPYVIVSAIIDYLKEVKSEHTLIINSDIIISDTSNYTEKLKELSEEGVVILNRMDYDNDISVSKLYEEGFDAFFVNGKHLEEFPQTLLCLGQCHWDYWLPYVASMSGVPIIRSKEPYIYHKRHNVQYSRDNWYRTAEIFRSEIGMIKNRNVQQVTGLVYRHIRTHLL
jgi:hypothetical protein